MNECNAGNLSNFSVTNAMVPIALLLQANLDVYQKFEEIMLQRPEKYKYVLQAQGSAAVLCTKKCQLKGTLNGSSVD